MVSLEPAEFKFLLRLLGCEGYEGTIADLNAIATITKSEATRICEALRLKGLVNYELEIARFVIDRPGRTLLLLDTTSLPVTPDELKLLKSCKGSMTPEKLGRQIPERSKQSLINNLAKRRLLKVTGSTMRQVWLTTKGKQFLCYEYEPSGRCSIGTADLMAHYVSFLRSHLIK